VQDVAHVSPLHTKGEHVLLINAPEGPHMPSTHVALNDSTPAVHDWLLQPIELPTKLHSSRSWPSHIFAAHTLLASPVAQAGRFPMGDPTTAWHVPMFGATLHAAHC
jgi:hypothetical protein